MNEGIHLDLDTWIVPGQIRKANLCRGLGNRPPLQAAQNATTVNTRSSVAPCTAIILILIKGHVAGHSLRRACPSLQQAKLKAEALDSHHPGHRRSMRNKERQKPETKTPHSSISEQADHPPTPSTHPRPQLGLPLWSVQSHRRSIGSARPRLPMSCRAVQVRATHDYFVQHILCTLYLRIWPGTIQVSVVLC